MEHAAKDGSSKVLRQCRLPLTGVAVIDLVITDLATFAIDRGQGMRLIELADGVSLDEVKAKTEADFAIAL
jgi:3-oxoacid CoA-transferase subunit B